MLKSAEAENSETARPKLSSLDWDPEMGTRMIYTKLEKVPRQLPLETSLILRHQFIKTLTLVENNISDASFLDSLVYLESLDLSGNRLAAVPNLPSLTRLSELYLERNQIMKMDAVSCFPGLVSLNLDKNLLTSISGGVSTLKYIRHLSITSNGISSISGLICPSVEFLDLRNNRIRAIPASLNEMTTLKELFLTNNYVAEVETELTLPYLHTIDLEGNNLHDFDAIRRLRQLASLRNLKLKHNPLETMHIAPTLLPSFLPSISGEELFRLSILHTLPKLTDLNNAVVNVEETNRAKELNSPDEHYQTVIKETESKLKLLMKPARFLDLEKRWYSATPPLLLVGPTGAGKRTLTQKLVSEYPQFKFCPSFTTRKPKPGEREGVDYCFRSFKEVQKWVNEGRAIQSAQFFGDWYVTLFQSVWDIVVKGHIPVLDLEIEGALEFKQMEGMVVKCIAITAPSVQILGQRREDRVEKHKQTLKVKLESDKRIKEDSVRRHQEDFARSYYERKSRGEHEVIQIKDDKEPSVPSLEQAVHLEMTKTDWKMVNSNSSQAELSRRNSRKSIDEVDETDRLVSQWLDNAQQEPRQTSVSEQRELLYKKHLNEKGFADLVLVNDEMTQTFRYIADFVEKTYQIHSSSAAPRLSPRRNFSQHRS